MITTEQVEKLKKNAPSEVENDVVAEKNKKKKLIKYVILGLAGAGALYFIYTRVIVKKQSNNTIKADL